MTNAIKQQQGFTLFELLIVLAISTVIVSILVSYYLSQNRLNILHNEADIAIEEILQIGGSAKNFYASQGFPWMWPDQANNCANAINVLTTATPTSYLSFVGPTSVYGTNYITNCSDTRTFTVQLTSNADFADYIQNQTPATSFVGTSTTTTISSFPAPDEAVNTDLFLLLDGSRPMLGDLDMAGNAITNTSNVITPDGRTLWRMRTIDFAGTSTTVIRSVDKPTICPTGTSPTIHISTIGAVLSSGPAILTAPYIDTSTSTTWDIGLSLFDASGVPATPTTGTYVLAMTGCV